MPVPMMQVGIVRVPMNQADVPVAVGVRFAGRHAGCVGVLVVRVVDVGMLVFHRLVHVRVVVTFRQVQPKAEAHQAAGDHQPC